MRRDMDLVRSILLQAEAADGPLDMGDMDPCGHTEEEAAYHVELMAQRGLVSATVRRAYGGALMLCRIDSLTWEGQDMLDAMRSERVWSRARRAIAESVGTATFDVVKGVCSAIAQRMALDAVGL